jgi:hypothetical protein
LPTAVLGEPGVGGDEAFGDLREAVQAPGAHRIGVGAVHLRLVAVREAVAERGAEVLPAVAPVLDPDLGAVDEVLVVAARAEDVAHAPFAVQHAFLEGPLAVAQRIAGDDALLGGGLLDARTGTLGGDLPVLEGLGVEDRDPAVLRVQRRGRAEHQRGEQPSLS